MDKCLNALLKYARDLLFKRAKNLSENANLHKEKVIKERLEQATKMSYEIVQLNELWQVKTGTGTKSEISYEVIKNQQECPEQCRILCRSCKTCPHIYECNFYDFLAAMNICKHIHYVIIKSNAPNNEDPQPEIAMEIQAIEEFLHHNQSLVQNETQDQEIINCLEVLLSMIKNPLLERKDEDAQMLLGIVENYIPKFSTPIEGPSREPHNKNAEADALLF